MAYIKQTGFSPGGRYTVQVRAKSKTDPTRISEWSNVYSFTTSGDTIPPAPVTDLTMVSEGSSFIAKWKAPTTNANGTVCTDLAGYWIYFANTDNPTQITRELFTTDASFTLDFVSNKEMFGVAHGNLTAVVKAVDQMGNRSTKTEVEASNPRPADVTGLVVTPGVENISINWDKNTTDLDLVGYEVHVSTTGASFTPSGSTLKFSGPGTSFVLPSSNPVPHHVKVRAVDIFGLYSQNDAYAVATPKTTTGSDGTPPGAPTAVAISEEPDGRNSTVKLSWTAPVDTDLDHFEVRYSVDNVDWSYVNIPAGTNSVKITGLRPATAYYVSVRAVDFSGNRSAWVNAPTYPYTTGADSTPIPTPSAPVAMSGVSKVLVAHTLEDTTGTFMTGIARLEIHMQNDNSAPAPGPFSRLAEISTAGSTMGVSTLISLVTEPDTEYYWYVVAVGENGLKSLPSAITLSTPGLIEGAYIADATIDDAKINNLSANKLEANSAFINDLYIRSKLTIDDATGEIRSSNYDAGLGTGWRINKSGITINEGIIKAKALEIQSSPNIIPAHYSGFEFNKAMYSNTSDVVNNAFMFVSEPSMRITTSVDAKYGNQSLQVTDTSTGETNIGLSAPGGYPVDVDALQTYIVSAYVKNLSASVRTLSICAEMNGGRWVIAAKNVAPSDGWVRIHVLVPLTATETKMRVEIYKGAGSAATYLVDGVQVERQIGAQTTPGNYAPPGLTSMAGEGIVTGSIRSSSPAIGGDGSPITGQPAWSLNTQGNMQVGDALIRGNLIVGAGADTTNSVVKSSNYLAGVSGWIIKGDGDVEFNNGTFRSTLLLERITGGITLRLKGSVADNIIYTPGSTTNTTTIATPMLSGQHYAYDRTLQTGGWYVPTVPNQNKKMRFSVGPTSAKNFVIQTNDNDTDGIYGSLPPDNTLLNTLTLGEQINYQQAPVIREASGLNHLLYQRENPTAQIRLPNGGLLTTTNFYYNTNYVGNTNLLNIRSPFTPDSNNKQNSLTEYFSRAENTMEAQAAYYSPAKNLMTTPWDYSLGSGNIWGTTPSYNDQVGPGTGGVTTFGSIGVTGWALSGMMLDSNYKIPCFLVNLNPTASNNCGFYFMTTSQSVATTPHTGFRRGNTYIFSIFIRNNLVLSGTTGTSPGQFTLTMGLRMQTTGTSFIDYPASVVVEAGKAQRVSVAITLPAGSPEFNRCTPYLLFPAFGSANSNRQIAVSRPQIEQKTWGANPNPDVANSNAPTAWGPAANGTRSENYSALKLVTQSNSDWLYDAYGRYDPDQSSSYAAEAVKTYREAPNYLDIQFDRKSIKSNGSYAGESNSTVYRFSEAGIMYPGAYEPMRPSGIEVTFNNRNLAPNTRTELTDFTMLSTMTTYGADDIRREGNNGLKFMRTGFYMIHCGVNVPSDQDLLWMTFDLNNVPFHSQGIGRIYTAGMNSATVKFFNRGEVFRAYMNSGPANGATRTVEGPRIAIVRIA